MATSDERITALLAAKAELDTAAFDLDRTLADQGLDSLHLMELAVWVRNEYGVHVAEEEMSPEQTGRDLLSYLAGRIG